MAEDIQIGADASQAISEFRKLESAVLSSMKAAGASTKELNATSRGMERTFAGVAAAAVRSSQSVTSAAKAENSAVKSQVSALEELARARATAATGVKINAAGKAVDASTGRFAGNAAAAEYNAQVTANRRSIQVQEEHNRRVLQLEGDLQNRLAAMRNRKDNSAGGESYQKRQAELEKAFSGSIVGLANPDATKLQRFANVLNQIPPATWNQKLQGATDSIMNMSNSTRYALYEVANSATVAGAAFIAFGAFAIGAAVAHERAFANVARTTQTTTEGYEVLRRQLEVMSMELPITYDELTKIASAAGQLGIGASGISAFTRTVAQLTATTNLTSDAAGIALARFRTFFAESDDPRLAVTEATFSNLASSILKVGVNSIASESGIVNVATQIASMGEYAGLTANQVIGLAGALSSIGVAPELARGTITRTFTLIGNAVSDGGVRLAEFAKLSGRSSAEFSAAWGTADFAGVFTDLMAGIKGVSDNGGDANLMLQELGFNSVRDRPLLLRLAGAADEAGTAGALLSQTLADAYEGWTRNSELALQYSKISTTTSARIQVLGQAFEQLAASMGEQSGSFLGDLAVQLTAVVRGFEAFSNTDAGQVLGTFVVQGALAVGALLLLVGGLARTAASIQAVGTAFTEFGASAQKGAAVASIAMRGLSAAMGVIGLVATIATVVGGFIAMGDAAAKAKLGIQDFDGLVSAMAQDAEDGSRGIAFFSEASATAALEQRNAAQQAAGMTEALYGIVDSSKAGALGMDALAASSKRIRFVFGDTAKEFYRSQLLASESFQGLFDPERAWNGFGSNLKDLGLDKVNIDWNGLMQASVSDAGIDKDKLLNSLMEQTGIRRFNEQGEFSEGFKGLQKYVDEIGGTFGSLAPEIQRVINSQAALQTQSKETFSEIYDGSGDAATAIGELDEVTQKMVDGIAKGFASFADTGTLIGLAQKLSEAQSAEDPEAAAQEFEKAWTDAYGGTAFSLQQYLDVFSRGAGEQQSFIEDLSGLRQRLSDLGVDPAFLNDLAEMGPEANRLVEALVTGTDEQLIQFQELWGKTGYDSMILFATQAAIGEAVVSNVLRNNGLEGLRAFNDALASGQGTTEALAALQLDVNGMPIKPAVDTPVPLTWAQKQIWAEQNRLETTARVRFVGAAVVRSNATTGGHSIENVPWANGGYTGPGGKYEPAGTVHRGEFVMDAESTRAIGVNNLYSLMRSASSGRAAPRGKGGYAQGGYVTAPSGGSNTGYIGSFGPMAVQQMMAAFSTYVSLDGKQISENSSSQYERDTQVGAY